MGVGQLYWGMLTSVGNFQICCYKFLLKLSLKFDFRPLNVKENTYRVILPQEGDGKEARDFCFVILVQI